MNRRLLILPLLVLAVSSGCDATPPAADDGGVQGAAAQNPGGPSAPATAAPTLRVVKDGRVLLVVDLAPEAARLRALGAPARADYLMRQALRETRAIPADRPEFADKDGATVRIVFLAGRDEYGQPQWGSAVEVGAFGLSRAGAASVQPAVLEALHGDALRRLFESVEIHDEAMN